MNRSSTLLWLPVACALGCGSSPPPEQLQQARAAYSRAERSQARQLSPTELHEAKVALDHAERAYEHDNGSEKAKDFAYIAQRKAELAQVQASTMDLQRQKQDMQAAQQQAQAKAAEEAKGELEMTRGELEQRNQALESERAARTAAEAEAQAALEELAAANAELQLREDARGTVITMPGTLMFATGQANLRPRSKAKLDTVADALREQGEKHIVVEGHTDSTGSEETNMRLSMQRAEAVRDYLIEEGVPANRITATGVGPARPVADNSTPEGRAENRRVEIVIEGAPMPSPSP